MEGIDISVLCSFKCIFIRRSAIVNTFPHKFASISVRCKRVQCFIIIQSMVAELKHPGFFNVKKCPNELLLSEINYPRFIVHM